VLYVANAPQVDITKVLTFINTVIVTADNGLNLANGNNSGVVVNTVP
jgi:polysaccharide export outer membrane protein